jgi:hypothetical protein
LANSFSRGFRSWARFYGGALEASGVTFIVAVGVGVVLLAIELVRSGAHPPLHDIGPWKATLLLPFVALNGFVIWCIGRYVRIWAAEPEHRSEAAKSFRAPSSVFFTAMILVIVLWMFILGT